MGLFDLTHMTRIEVHGPKAEELLQRALTIDVSKVGAGRMAYALLCNARGGIVDDLTIYRFQRGGFLIVCNPSTRLRVLEVLKGEARGYDVETEDSTFETAQLAVQGPRSARVVRGLLGVDALGMRWFSGLELKLNGVRAVLTRSGYTGEDGFELIIWSWEEGFLSRLWEGILRLNTEPCGAEARDLLRLEAAYPLHGQDMDEETTPVEARLTHAVDLSKPWFLGKEAVERAVRRGARRLLVGFKVMGPWIPERDGGVFNWGGRRVGWVTSGGFSYSIGSGIGLGYVDPRFAVEGKRVSVEAEGALREGEVRLGPFVPRKMR